MSLLVPSVVAAIEDLEVAARVVVEGLQVGQNRSPFHGYGAEFQQYRPYRAGDDLKHLDWKMYARSDRLYTRQFRETTSLSMLIVLDTSASMAYPTEGVSKARYATVLAASLAYLVVNQGNAVGLLARDGDTWDYLPARTGRPHMRRLLSRLEKLQPAGSWNGAETVRRAAELLQRRGLLVVISDFYDDEERVQQELRQVVQRGHDVSVMHVLSRTELSLDINGQVELQELETGERRLVDVAAAAEQYSRDIDAFVERQRIAAVTSGIEYALMPTDVPLEHALRDYLLQRQQ